MYNKLFKRFLDLILSIVFFPVLLLLFFIIAPLIKLEDGGPVFYNSDRLGKDGIPFKMYKFRTMRVNAPDIRNEDGSTYNSDIDPRVTHIGNILRKTSLDETPQILNVIKGDMSIIGPRPFIPVDNLHNVSEDFNVRLSVRPGITGFAQANYRNSISQSQKIKLDADYAKNVSFHGDVLIFLKTVKAVIFQSNINNN